MRQAGPLTMPGTLRPGARIVRPGQQIRSPGAIPPQAVKVVGAPGGSQPQIISIAGGQGKTVISGQSAVSYLFIAIVSRPCKQKLEFYVITYLFVLLQSGASGQMSGIAALAAAAAQTSKISTPGSVVSSQPGTPAGGIKVVTPSLMQSGIKVTQVPGRTQRSES